MVFNTHKLILPSVVDALDSPAVTIPSNAASKATWEITYADLIRLVNHTQHCLSRIGVPIAGTIALVLPNGIEFVTIFLAAIRQRIVTAPINPQFTKDECRDILKLTSPYLVVVLPANNDASVLAAKDLGLRVAYACCRRVVKAGDSKVTYTLDLDASTCDDTQDLSIPRPLVPCQDVWVEDRVLLLLTSGTTGPPKSVTLSHTNLLVAMRILTSAHKLTDKDRCLIITPLFHIIGIVGSLLTTLFTGGCAVIPVSLPAAFWQCCEKFGITWYHAVPTLHQLLSSFPMPQNKPPSSLRFVRSGGSDMAPDLFEKLAAMGLQVLEVYGMTETAPAIFCNKYDQEAPMTQKRLGHYPIPDAVDVAILPTQPDIESSRHDAGDGRLITPTTSRLHVSQLTKQVGIVGEICLRGKNIMSGYVSNEAANVDSFLSNGFFRTGDLGVITEDQHVALVGRMKEIINKGGEKISPAEIEHAARLHPDIVDVACFRIADKVYGEEIGIAVVRGPDAVDCTPASVKKLMRQHIAMFKVPQKVVFVNAIPYNRTGKPMRRYMAEQFARGLLEPIIIT